MRNKFIITAAILITACQPYSHITATWVNPKQPENAYYSILVVSMTPHVFPKTILEKDLAEQFEKNGISVYKSVDEFTPVIGKDTITKEELSEKIKQKNIDALLTVSLIKKGTDSRYVPGGCVYTPMTFGYYNNFWGYYSYWYPCVYSESYYVTRETYYIETNLYDGKTEELIWSAQSATYEYEDLVTFSKELSSVIVKRLKQDGVIKQKVLVRK